MSEVAGLYQCIHEDSFYSSTFSQREISYCLLQENPIQSFAGKFAAKEALIKIDGSLAAIPMNEIEILNDRKGRPFFQDVTLSISHTDRSAVAVAVRPAMAPLASTLQTGGASLQSKEKSLPDK